MDFAGQIQVSPSAVLLPASTAEVSGIVRLARKHGVQTIPYGGGSGIVGGSIPEDGEVIIDTKKLR